MNILALFLILCYTNGISSADVNRFYKQGSYNQSAIIGGSNALIRNFPFMGHLLLYFKLDRQGVCGSTILTLTALLTSAHCMMIWANLLRIRVSIGTAYPYSRGVYHRTTRYTIHPSYDDAWFDYDVAVVRTIERMYLDGVVSRVVALSHEAKLVPEGTNITILGWGFTKVGAKGFSTSMKQANVFVINMKLCLRIYEKSRVTVRIFCAKGNNIDRVKDHCGGDSGGPAINKDGVQVGIIQAGVHCGTTGVASTYMNVGMFYEWINKTAEMKNPRYGF